MIGIRRETDYAVRTVLHLATLGDGAFVRVADVAAQKLLPVPFVRRIVARLSTAGILATTRGMGGGIRLARPAAEISLLDVVRAMEEGVGLNECLEPGHTCPLLKNCPAHRAWAEATKVLEAHLATVRFDALAGTSREHVEAHHRVQKEARRRKAGSIASRAASTPPRRRGRTLS